MQAQLQKDQKELENTVYEGVSSFITIKINGKYEVIDVKVNIPLGEKIGNDDKEMLEDMFLVAMNDALNKIANDKSKKMGKYGQGLAGLM